MLESLGYPETEYFSLQGTGRLKLQSRRLNIRVWAIRCQKPSYYLSYHSRMRMLEGEPWPPICGPTMKFCHHRKRNDKSGIYIMRFSAQSHIYNFQRADACCCCILLSRAVSCVRTTDARGTIISTGRSKIVAWYTMIMSTRTARVSTHATHYRRYKATISIRRGRKALSQGLSWCICIQKFTRKVLHHFTGSQKQVTEI